MPAEYVKGFKTDSGDKLYDYNFLGNKPDARFDAIEQLLGMGTSGGITAQIAAITAQLDTIEGQLDGVAEALSEI